VSAGFRAIVGSALEAPAVVSGFDDIAVMGQAIERCGRHLGICEDARPFAEGEIGGDDDRGALVTWGEANRTEASAPPLIGPTRREKLDRGPSPKKKARAKKTKKNWWGFRSPSLLPQSPAAFFRISGHF
jgi:hypothetical protein